MPFNGKHLTVGKLKCLCHYDAIYHPSHRPKYITIIKMLHEKYTFLLENESEEAFMTTFNFMQPLTHLCNLFRKTELW